MYILNEKIAVFIYFLVTFSSAAEFSDECNEGTSCIVLNECTGLYAQLQNGTTTELTRLLRSLHCGFKNGLPEICCPPEFLLQRNESSSEANSVDLDPTTLLPNDGECGIQNNNRIIGGTLTDIDEHPWSVLLRYDRPVGWGFYCGGILISARYVLTAAHCVKSLDLPPKWKLSQVRLGEWNTSSENDCVHDDCAALVQDIPVEEIIPHEEYDLKDTNLLNDIALLRLSRNAQLTDFVKPICLPINNDLRQESYEGLEVEVVGWGQTESHTESDVKLKVRLAVVGNSDCADKYKKAGRQITGKQTCAGGIRKKDTCRGDSGGALMRQASSANNWMVIGVVSYGPSPCGTPGWPSIYTRVGAYIDWILSKIRP